MTLMACVKEICTFGLLYALTVTNAICWKCKVRIDIDIGFYFMLVIRRVVCIGYCI